MAHLAAGHRAIERLRKALGLGDAPLTKVVIEMDVRDVVRVYVKGPVRAEAIDALAGWVEMIPVDAVEVADDCTVTAVRSE